MVTFNSIAECKTAKTVLLSLVTACLICMSLNAFSEEKKITTPEFIEGTKKVTAEELIGLVDTIPEIIIVDSRIPGDRKQGYVEGSISLPDINTTCDSLSEIIPGKSSPSLFYCNGVKCGRSAKAIKIALGCGYNNIYWFRGGFEEWLAKGYPYQQE